MENARVFNMEPIYLLKKKMDLYSYQIRRYTVKVVFSQLYKMFTLKLQTVFHEENNKSDNNPNIILNYCKINKELLRSKYVKHRKQAAQREALVCEWNFNMMNVVDSSNSQDKKSRINEADAQTKYVFFSVKINRVHC